MTTPKDNRKLLNNKDLLGRDTYVGDFVVSKTSGRYPTWYTGYAEACKASNNIRILTSKTFDHCSDVRYRIPASGYINLSAPPVQHKED